MELLAALGLAGNIVQFVDFTCKLFSQGREIANSAVGASEDVVDAIAIATSIRDFSSRLVLPPDQSASSLATTAGHSARTSNKKFDAQLTQLATDCREAAGELLSGLESLRSRNPSSKWSGFSAALRTVWKERKINKMSQRLREYRQQSIFLLGLLQRY